MSVKTENRARVASTVMSNPDTSTFIMRNGVEWRRSLPEGQDKDVDIRIIPEGFWYQWNAFEVFNQPLLKNQTANYNAGWKPVPAARHDGVFMPPGWKGDITKDGLRLEERPLEWELQDRARLKRGAHEAINVSRERFKMDALPQGFTDNTKMVRDSTFIRQSNEVEVLPGSNAGEIPIAD